MSKSPSRSLAKTIFSSRTAAVAGPANAAAAATSTIRNRTNAMALPPFVAASLRRGADSINHGALRRHDPPGVVVRRERDRPPPDPLGSACRVELHALEDRRDHHLHLVHREARAEAAPDAAAEWDPGVGVGAAVQEALRLEALRLGED